MTRPILLFSLLLIFLPGYKCQAQQNSGTGKFISTGVPFLSIIPDARTSAMGEAGTGVPTDESDFHINAAKMAFVKATGGFSLSYIPWLSNISNELNIGYLNGYYRLDEDYVLGGSLKYFSMGTLDLRGSSEESLGVSRASEFAFDVSIAKRFGDAFSLGSSLRYIQSNMLTPSVSFGLISKPGRTIAIDVSARVEAGTYFADYPATIGLGIGISNLGPKISYSDRIQDKYFLPAALRIGVSSAIETANDSRLVFAMDLSKLLVPSSQSESGLYRDQSERSVVSGILSSFSDAPGGFSEEIREVGVALGAEYSYKNMLAFRGGYNYQHPEKGSSYLSFGTGLKIKAFNFDFSYLFADKDFNAQSKTMRFTLGYRFGGEYY